MTRIMLLRRPHIIVTRDCRNLLQSQDAERTLARQCPARMSDNAYRATLPPVNIGNDRMCTLAVAMVVAAAVIAAGALIAVTLDTAARDVGASRRSGRETSC
jgi:hypothetical protein